MITIKSTQIEQMRQSQLSELKPVLLACLLTIRPGARSHFYSALCHLIETVLQDSSEFGIETKRELVHFTVLSFDFGVQFYSKESSQNVRAILVNPELPPLVKMEQAHNFMHH